MRDTYATNLIEINSAILIRGRRIFIQPGIFGDFQLWCGLFNRDPRVCLGAKKVRWEVIPFVPHFGARMDIEAHVVPLQRCRGAVKFSREG